MECDVAPKQGRSGGGLFTIDGYIAGVCNFAEPQGDHGLYATPRSIYSLLNRNNLMALYAPATRGSADLLADGRPGVQPRRNAPVSVARSQSPDNEEPDQSRGRAAQQRCHDPAPQPSRDRRPCQYAGGGFAPGRLRYNQAHRLASHS